MKDEGGLGIMGSAKGLEYCGGSISIGKEALEASYQVLA